MTILTPDGSTSFRLDYITMFTKTERTPYQHKLYCVSVYVLNVDKPFDILFSNEADRNTWFDKLNLITSSIPS